MLNRDYIGGWISFKIQLTVLSILYSKNMYLTERVDKGIFKIYRIIPLWRCPGVVEIHYIFFACFMSNFMKFYIIVMFLTADISGTLKEIYSSLAYIYHSIFIGKK